MDEIGSVINDGASAYRGVIPADQWHEPYLSAEQLRAEIERGVQFTVLADEGDILGVMGVQDQGPVALIRHAYVRTSARRRGIGAQLLKNLVGDSRKPILIGTWKAAVWAIDFYEKYGFVVLPDAEARALLEKFWHVPERQMETSVVLADERYLRTGRPPAGKA
jgi:N-acetylglutamate synthase-like GNAT family acetyltransferase